MSFFTFLLFVGLVAAAAASGNFQENCDPGSGDLLLEDMSLISLVIGGKQLNKNYPGHKLTCVKCTKGLLDVLGNLLNISVLQGGYQCDSVLLEVNIGNLGSRCRVWGRKLLKGESPDC